MNNEEFFKEKKTFETILIFRIYDKEKRPGEYKSHKTYLRQKRWGWLNEFALLNIWTIEKCTYQKPKQSIQEGKKCVSKKERNIEFLCSRLLDPFLSFILIFISY